MSKQKTSKPAEQKPNAPRIFESYWFERVIFVIGAVLIFLGEFAFLGTYEDATYDVTYYDQNIQQLQNLNRSREISFSDYNRAVSAVPQNPNVVGQTAYNLFRDTDQLLTLLRGVVEHKGQGEILTLIAEKHARLQQAEQELYSGSYEALVRRMKEAHADHETNVEVLTASMMVARQQAIEHEMRWSRTIGTLRLVGTLLLGLAFVFREIRELRKREAGSS